MSLVVQTNNAAVTALKHLGINNMNMNKALERLSSGFRINSAADDAAGFAIASKMNAFGERLKAASLNASQGTALVKTADAALNEIQNIITRIQTLAVQASSANNGDTERAKLDAERIKLESQIDNFAATAEYNGLKLLNGSAGATAAVTQTVGTGVTAAKVTSASPGSYSYTVAANGAAFDITVSNGNGLSEKVTVTAPAAGSTKTVSFATMGLELTVDSTLAAGDNGTIAVSGNPVAFQVGAQNTGNDRVTVDLSQNFNSTGTGTAGLGLAGTTATLTTATGAQA